MVDMVKRKLTFGLAALAGIGLALVASRALASGSFSFGPNVDTIPYLPPDPSQQGNVEMDLSNTDPNARVPAFLAMIRKFEANGQYNVLYGGGHFSDYSKHPDVKVPFTDGAGNRNYSTAAGGYQINYPTWSSEIQPVLDLPDFTPPSQDAAAIYLLQKIGVVDALNAGDFDTALRLASKRWASLPYSTANQNPQTVADASDTFTNFLNSFA